MEQFETSIFGSEERELVLASQGKRFLNMLIDGFIYSLLYQLFTAVATYFWGYDLIAFFGYENVMMIFFSTFMISICIQVLFFTLVEALFKGKSLGKLITGTRAVNEDGTYISTKTALLRSLSRLVPFEAFSALGTPCHPWHDRWTNTYVIDEKQTNYPNVMVKEV